MRIPARGKGLVETGLAVAVPGGTCEFFLLHSDMQCYISGKVSGGKNDDGEGDWWRGGYILEGGGVIGEECLGMNC